MTEHGTTLHYAERVPDSNDILRSPSPSEERLRRSAVNGVCLQQENPVWLPEVNWESVESVALI